MKKQNNKYYIMKKEKGITLIALVITIVILLILSVVSIAILTGKNGILMHAQEAKQETEQARIEEENTLTDYESYINAATEINTEFMDSLGNKVVVPAGFKVINPEDNVEDGIIIEDVTYKNTKGSQFVWIPVGDGIKKKDGTTFEVSLGRYTFDSDGIPTDQGSNVIDDNYQELGNSTYGNITAKNIEEFKTNTVSNGGYYIGRYEAKDRTTNIARTATTSDDNQIVCTNSNYIYNFVNQSQAATLSQKMYNSSNFESDLVNSYAWDTAIVFIQKCSSNNKYSQQNSLNTGNLATMGTTNDVICNIYDMASNCFEWTTETSFSINRPCSSVGGYYGNEYYTTSRRRGNDGNYNFEFQSFRPIIYFK